MLEVNFDADGTIEEFRTRAERLPGIQLNLESPMVTALASALWFAVEHYEDHIGNEINPKDLEDRMNLHRLCHDHAGILRQLFATLGLDLVNLPYSCRDSSDRPRGTQEDIEALKGLIDRVENLRDSIHSPKVKVVDVDLPEDESEKLEDEVSDLPQTGSVDSEDKPE